ncbi:MAG TPA: hypothetical protein VNN72_22895, partial [Polyangiaceae bacterium]|nr:hypothetical protein [Polyangiaceae bacterium]
MRTSTLVLSSLAIGAVAAACSQPDPGTTALGPEPPHTAPTSTGSTSAPPPLTPTPPPAPTSTSTPPPPPP